MINQRRSLRYPLLGRIRYSMLSLLTVVTVTCIALGWFYRRQPYVATAYLEIRFQPPNAASMSGDTFAQQREIFCQSQITLLKSHFVLKAALSRRDIAQLNAVVRQGEDALTWLTDALEISFSGRGEILELRMAGSEAVMPEYCALIDAIIQAYTNEVLYKEMGRLSQAQSVKKELTLEIRDELISKIEEMNTLAKELGEEISRDNPHLVLLRAEVELITEQWKELEKQLRQEDVHSETSQESFLIIQHARSQKQ